MDKPRYNDKKNGRKPYRSDRPKRASSAFAAMEQLDSQETAGDAGLIEGRNAVWEALQSGRQLEDVEYRIRSMQDRLEEQLSGVQRTMEMLQQEREETVRQA